MPPAPGAPPRSPWSPRPARPRSRRTWTWAAARVEMKPTKTAPRGGSCRAATVTTAARSWGCRWSRPPPARGGPAAGPVGLRVGGPRCLGSAPRRLCPLEIVTISVFKILRLSVTQNNVYRAVLPRSDAAVRSAALGTADQWRGGGSQSGPAREAGGVRRARSGPCGAGARAPCPAPWSRKVSCCGRTSASHSDCPAVAPVALAGRGRVARTPSSNSVSVLVLAVLMPLA